MNNLSLDLPSAALDNLDIRQRNWLKRVLPNTLFGRALLLIVIPLILVQIISAWVFYARHWGTVAHRFAADVASEIGLVGEGLKLARSDAPMSKLMEFAESRTEVVFRFEP